MNINNNSAKGKDVREVWWGVRGRSQANSEGVFIVGSAQALRRRLRVRKAMLGGRVQSPEA